MSENKTKSGFEIFGQKIFYCFFLDNVFRLFLLIISAKKIQFSDIVIIIIELRKRRKKIHLKKYCKKKVHNDQLHNIYN
jgi:hypothetical protein